MDQCDIACDPGLLEAAYVNALKLDRKSVV